MSKLTTWMTCGMLMLGATTAFAAGEPNAFVQGAVDELAEKLDGRREELAADRKALYALIDGMLLPRFDRRGAAQLVLARHWRSASDAQKKRFIDAFYNALLRRYADGVLEFEADRIEILPFRGDASARRVTVRTMVTLNDGTRVPVDYTLIRRGDDWKMIDVVIEGISYIRNYRSELATEIAGSSLDAVIERLETEAGSGDETSGDDVAASG